jgi:hypothetical protein
MICYSCELPMDDGVENEMVLGGRVRMVCDYCQTHFNAKGYKPLGVGDVKQLFIAAANGYKENREFAKEKFLWHVAERILYNMTHYGAQYSLVDIRFALLEIAMRGERV